MASVRKREWTSPNGEKKEAWVVSYTDQGGKRRLKTYDRKKDADKGRLKIEMEIEQGGHVPDSQTVTVASLSAMFLEHCKERVKDGRIGPLRYINLERFMRLSLVPFLGNRLVARLTPDDFTTLYSKLCSLGTMTPDTAKERIKSFQALQDYAVRKKVLKQRPVSEALRELRNVKRGEIRTFTKDEVIALLKTARTGRAGVHERTTRQLECIVHVAAFCGLRFGEIMGLCLGNLDLDGRMIHVRHSYCYVVGLKDPKTKAGIRSVPCPPHLVTMLRDFIAQHHRRNKDNLVFSTISGGVITRPNFHAFMWKPLLIRAGLSGETNLHFHALRHFAASWWIDDGMSPLDASKIIGHSRVSTTLSIYAHAVQESDRRRNQIDNMSSALISAPLTIDLTAVPSDAPCDMSVT